MSWSPQEQQLICEAQRHGPARLLERLQSLDCDGHGSGADPLGLVQPEDKPAAAQSQRGERS